MGRRIITKEDYQRMLDAFRSAPGNYSHASKLANCWHGTCKKAWNDGWPKQGMDPIKEVLYQEQRAARAALEVSRREGEVEAERQIRASVEATQGTQAGTDAIMARTEEARLVRGARNNAVGLMATTAQLLQGGHKLAKHLKQRIEEELDTITPSEATKMITAISSLTKQGNEAAKVAMTMERLHLGEPTEHKEVTVNTSFSVADAEKEILAAAEELKRLQNATFIDAEVKGE